jgi:hypothetical protein
MSVYEPEPLPAPQEDLDDAPDSEPAQGASADEPGAEPTPHASVEEQPAPDLAKPMRKKKKKKKQPPPVNTFKPLIYATYTPSPFGPQGVNIGGFTGVSGGATMHLVNETFFTTPGIGCPKVDDCSPSMGAMGAVILCAGAAAGPLLTIFGASKGIVGLWVGGAISFVVAIATLIFCCYRYVSCR